MIILAERAKSSSTEGADSQPASPEPESHPSVDVVQDQRLYDPASDYLVESSSLRLSDHATQEAKGIIFRRVFSSLQI